MYVYLKASADTKLHSESLVNLSWKGRLCHPEATTMTPPQVEVEVNSQVSVSWGKVKQNQKSNPSTKIMVNWIFVCVA